MSQTLQLSWAIVRPAWWRRAKPGQMVMCGSTHFTRADAIRAWLKVWDLEKRPSYGKWSHWYRQGYRAVRVQVVMP
jgi:hypothetical protein